MEENQKLQSNLRGQFINLGIIIVLIIITFYVLYRKSDDLNFHSLYNSFIHMKKEFVILAFGSMITFIIAEGQCLAILARSLGYKMALKSATAYSTADLYFSAITPSATGGQPASAYYMIKDGVKGSDATTILVLNIFLYTLSLVILGTTAIITHTRIFFESGKLFQAFFIIGFAIQGILVVICLLCMFSKNIIRKLQHLLVIIINKIKFIKNKEEKALKVERFIVNYQTGVDFVKKQPFTMIKVLIGNLIQRIAFFSIGYFIYRGLGFEHVGYWDVIAVQCLLAMVAYSIPVPGAVGISEGGFLLLFRTIIPQGALMPAMMFTRVLNYYLCFILCGIYTIIYHIKIMRNTKRERKK